MSQAGTLGVLTGNVNTITGTSNEVLVNGTSGSPVSGNITLTTPQAIGTTSDVTFDSVTFAHGSALNTYISPNSWTPVLQFGGVTLSGGTRAGTYMKIGTLVFYTVDIILSSIAGAAGNALITNLPFAVSSNDALYICSIQFQNGMSIDSGFMGAAYVANDSNITLLELELNGSAGQALTQANFTNTSAFYISGFYFSSS